MNALLTTALRAAEAASLIHLRHFGSVGVAGAREKTGSDFVSRVDLEAQEAALGVIRARHPEHRILAEEEGEEDEEEARVRDWPEDGRPLWIVDPLDGTTNFLHRHPHFCASVAVGRRTGKGEGGGAFRGGILEAGAVVAARTGERWWASRDGGAWKNGLPVSVSSSLSLATALVGTGFPFKAPDLVDTFAEELTRVLPACGGVRRCGSAALDLCYLAEGILDAFWEEAYLSPWDVAAGVLVVREAGGVVTRLDGSPLTLEAGGVLGGNSPELLRALGRLVRDEAKGK